MAEAATNDDEDYIRQYGDNPNAPSVAPGIAPITDSTLAGGKINAADRAAPYNATQDFLNAAALSGNLAGGVLPGVGQLGSTDITDQTNLNVAAAMERADLAGRISPQAPIPSVASTAMDEFGQRRQDIESQRTQLMAKLGMIPPSAAGLAAVVLPSSQRPRGGGPSEYEKAFEQLNYLDNQSRFLLQEHHYSAIENARQAHENLARNTHIQVSTGIAKMMNAISQANQQYGVGSPEARAAIVGAYTGNDPDIAAARGTKTFEDRIKPYTDLHDVSEARLKAAIAAHQASSNLPITSIETTATGGINVRSGTPKTATAETELKPYGVTPAQIQNPVGAQVGRISYVDASGKPLANPTFTPDSSGDVVQMAGTTTKAGKTPPANIPIDIYLKHGGKLGAQDQAAQAAKTGGTVAVPTPAPTATAVPGTANQVAGGTNTVTLTTAPTVITTQEDYNALPKGGYFIHNGKLGQKPK